MAIRKVRDNVTGEIIQVDDSQLGNYGLSAPTQQPQPAPVALPVSNPEAQVRGSLAESVGKSAIGIAGSFINPVVDFANKALAEQKQAVERTKKGDIGSAIKEAAKATARTFISPESGKAAADVASFAVPFGKAGFAGSKFLAPGAATGLLQGASQGDNPTELVGDTVLGAGSGVAAQVGSKLLPAISKGTKSAVTKIADKGSKTLAVKGIKPSPSQQLNFYKDTGEKLDDFLVKRGLGGADINKIDGHISSLQDQFDQVVGQPNLTIDLKSVTKKFDDEIKRLNDSVLPADKRKAEAIQGIKDNFIAKYGNETAGADVVTSLRRDVDAGIRDFQLDPAVKGPLNITRDILQGSVREAADQAGIKIEGKSLKEAGMELSKLYKLQEIADRQQFNGQGAAPAGLYNLLGGIAGGSTGGIPGMVIGGMAASAINSPKTLNAGSKILSGIADGAVRLPEIPQMGNKMSQVVGQTAARLPALPVPNGPTNENTNNNQTQEIVHNDGNIPESSSNVNTTDRAMMPEINSYVTEKSPQEHAQAYQAALMAGNTKAAAQIKNLYDMEVQYQKDNTSKGKNLSGANSVLVNKASTALKSLDRITSALTADPNLMIKKLNPLDQSGRQLGADITSAIDVLGYFRTGATLTPAQRADYISLFPTALDDEATKKQKIANLRAEFEGYVEGLKNSAEPVSQQSPAMMPPIQ